MKLDSRATAVAAALIALASTTTVVARQEQQPPLAAKMSVASFDPWSDATRPLRYEIVVTNIGTRPIEDPVVRTTIYRRMTSRSALHVALEGRRLRNVVAATTDSLAGPIAPGETRRQPVVHNLTELANVFRNGIGGVYPIEITLTGSDRELASGITAAVFIGEPPKFRLNAAIVLPVQRPAMFDPDDGTYTEAELERDLGASGFVSRTAALLAASMDVPLTIAPGGLLLDELANLADGYRIKGSDAEVEADDRFAVAATDALAQLKTAAAAPAFEVATAAYAWADLVPLFNSGLGTDLERQVRIGRSTVTDRLARAPSTELFISAGGRMDARTAEAVHGLGIRSMVVASDVVPPQSGQFGPDHPLIASGSGGVAFPVLLADDATATRLTQPGDADKRLVAQGIIAEAAMAYFERPSLSATRAFVIAPPVMPHPDITSPVVRALSRAPWITLRTASDLIKAVPAPEREQPFGAGEAAGGRFATAVRAATSTIEVVAQTIVSAEAVTRDLDRLVLASESYDWVADPARAEQLAGAARRRARAILDKIAVVPRPDASNPRRSYRKVTLTARAGPLPVTVQNDTGFPISLKVRVRSAKVSFERDTALLVGVQRRETVTFTAAARASGVSPVAVDLLTCRDAPMPAEGEPPEGLTECAAGRGGRPIGSGTVLVQSSAVSAVALAATGGGAAFLLAAWVRRSMRRRRNGNTTTLTPEKQGDDEIA